MEGTKAFLKTVELGLASIRAAAQHSDYFYEQVRFLCNAIGPRLSGSPQAAAAVEYVCQQMRDLGLEVRLGHSLSGTGSEEEKRLTWCAIQGKRSTPSKDSSSQHLGIPYRRRLK